jgi:hypothetical protein
MGKAFPTPNTDPLYTTPVIYLYLDRLQRAGSRDRRPRAACRRSQKNWASGDETSTVQINKGFLLLLFKKIAFPLPA